MAGAVLVAQAHLAARPVPRVRLTKYPNPKTLNLDTNQAPRVYLGIALTRVVKRIRCNRTADDHLLHAFWRCGAVVATDTSRQEVSE